MNCIKKNPHYICIILLYRVDSVENILCLGHFDSRRCFPSRTDHAKCTKHNFHRISAKACEFQSQNVWFAVNFLDRCDRPERADDIDGGSWCHIVRLLPSDIPSHPTPRTRLLCTYNIVYTTDVGSYLRVLREREYCCDNYIVIW